MKCKVIIPTLVAIVVGLFVPQVAEGHYINQSQSENIVYNQWNGNCGNGISWTCAGTRYLGSYQIGYHSYMVTYTWREISWPSGNGRDCSVTAQTYHNTYHHTELGESCSG